MAAVMAAGMTPPLGLALATVLRKRLFTEPEIENGKAAWILGASFITEGAIPFAAAAPLRVIPATWSAPRSPAHWSWRSATRCAHRTAASGWSALITNPFLYLLAVAIGTVITAFAVIFLKGLGKRSRRERRAGGRRRASPPDRFHPAHRGRGCDDVCRSPGFVSHSPAA